MNEQITTYERTETAKELSALQRLGFLSVDTDAVERTMRGEFDQIIEQCFSFKDAADAIHTILCAQEGM